VLYKKIKGVPYYFGYADDPRAAVDRYNRQRDNLYAGRKPRDDECGLRMVDLINTFLSVRNDEVRSGALAQRSWNDYDATCGRILKCFGRNRIVADLRPEDFRKLRSALQRGRNLTTLGNEIQRVRTVFKYIALSAEGRYRLATCGMLLNQCPPIPLSLKILPSPHSNLRVPGLQIPGE
jgi:hypothetical protein